MAVRANINVRIKLIVLLVFAFFLAAALWKDQTLAKKNDDTAVKTAPQTVQPLAAQPEQNYRTETPTADDVKIEGCAKCHDNIEPMHRYNNRGDVFDKLDEGKDAQGLTCTACHGGNPVATTQKDAHVQPKFPKEWGCKNGECSSRNPERTNTLLAKETREFVRFVNPGDFRVISQSCGQCHSDENEKVSRSMMAHGSMLWGAALYNNGGFHIKDARFGESYNEDGKPSPLTCHALATR